MITAGGTSLAGSLVLCVGSDGHADLEVALGGCCVDEDIISGDLAGDPVTGLIESCGSCADLELDATPLTKEKHRLEAPSLLAVNGIIPVMARADSMVNSDSFRNSGPPHLEGLATVVLLT